MRWLGVIMVMAALLASAPGYASAQPAGEKGLPPAVQPPGPEVKGEAPGPAKSFTPEERQAYEKKTAADLEVMEQRLQDLVGSVQKVIPQKKRQVIKIMRGLQVQTLAARNQLTALEKAPEDTWSGLKVNMDKTMAELKTNWEASEPHLK